MIINRARTLILAVLSTTATADFARSQTTWTVDNTPGSPYQSITTLINTQGGSMSPGDVIEVVGNLTPNGEVIPYSEYTGETFPITLPEGLKITSKPGTQAVIGSIYSSSSGALLQCEQGVSGTLAHPTLIWDLWFGGGDVAIQIDDTGQHEKWVDIRDCRFGGNTVGVSAIMQNGFTLHMQVKNSDFAPGQPASYYAPSQALQNKSSAIGVRLHAISVNGTPSLLEATIDSLDTAGGTIPTTTAAWPAGNATTSESTLEGQVSNLSRFIEVFSMGLNRQVPVIGPIDEVALTITGCSINGDGAQQNVASWDVGVLALTESDYAGGGAEGYASGFDINISGTIIRNMDEAGIAASSAAYARGLINISGQSLISDTGSQNSAALLGARGTGVYGFVWEGYLAITGDHTSISDNDGHGVLIDTTANAIADFDGDIGAYLGLDRCNLHGNEGDGVRLLANYQWQSWTSSWATTASAIGSVVGGTTRRVANIGSYFSGSGDSSTIPSGPGYLTRCAISNNGGHGFLGAAGGLASSSLMPPRAHAVSISLVNSAIWNNPLGGVVLVGDDGGQGFPGSGRGPHLMVPVVHCSVAGNGSSTIDSWTGIAADYNIEAVELSGHGPNPPGNSYAWTDPNGVITSSRFVHNVLERKNSQNTDYGPSIEPATVLGIGVAENPTISSVPATKIAIGGTRAWMRSGSPLSVSAPLMTSLAAPWGAVTWTSRSAMQFVLPSSAPTVFRQTMIYLHAAATHAGVDFFGATRDTLGSGAREKGFDEI